MKLRVTVVALVVLAVCYLAAGSPAVALLFKPSVVSDAIALKPITYHWANRADRAIPAPELLASRFYVLVLAGISVTASVVAFRKDGSAGRFAFVLLWAVSLFAILLYAQTQAFYTVG